MSLAGCTHHGSFRVQRSAPDYLLRLPDLRKVPFAEVLATYNGFRAGLPSIDLRPQMQLRVENAYYQPGASRRGLAGFLGTEVAQYRVTPQGLVLLATRPMAQRPEGEAPVQELISADVSRHPLYRFYFEILFRNNGDAHGSVLLGANTAEELNKLSAQLERPETVCFPGSVQCAVFPEACSVSAEIEVKVNGQPKTVPWTSKLSAVVHQPHALTMRRLSRGQLLPLKLDVRDPGSLALPLLPGDEIRWR